MTFLEPMSSEQVRQAPIVRGLLPTTGRTADFDRLAVLEPEILRRAFFSAVARTPLSEAAGGAEAEGGGL